VQQITRKSCPRLKKNLRTQKSKKTKKQRNHILLHAGSHIETQDQLVEIRRKKKSTSLVHLCPWILGLSSIM
jgi:fatty acid/phospholipid biosynthesis enzyme